MSDKTPKDPERSVDPSLDPEDVSLDPNAPELDPAGELLADENVVDPGEFVVASDEGEAEELDPATDEDDADQTVVAEAEAIVAGSTRPVKRRTSQAPVRKAESTAKRSEHKHTEPYENEKPAGPVTFSKQAVGELKKVNWPTPDQLRVYFFAVLAFVLFVIAYVGLLDLGFGAALLALFG